MSALEAIAATLAVDPGIRCVAVDRRTASGKTTFATTLAGRVAALGRSTVHAQLDGFHNPRRVCLSEVDPRASASWIVSN